MRMLVAAFACGVALTSSAHAELGYSLNDFLGTWYGESEVVPAGERRVVPARIEITETPTLRGPRRFHAHLWIRCMDRPREVCDLGVADVTPVPGNGFQLPIRRVSRHANALEFCGFNMILTSGTFADGVTYERFRKDGLQYTVSPGRANCRRSEFTGIARSSGYVNRTPPYVLPERLRPRPIPDLPQLPQPLPRP